MPPIRVFLAAKRRLLNDIFEAILEPYGDVEVVGTLTEGDALMTAMSQVRADVVLMELGHTENADVFTELLYQFPRIKVLATTSDSRGAVLCELQPNQVSLGDLSAPHLLDAIRAAVRPSAV